MIKNNLKLISYNITHSKYKFIYKYNVYDLAIYTP